MTNAYVVAGHGKDQDRVAVGSSLVIGRSAHCGLVLHDVSASRQHVEIRCADGAFVCRDLGSRNGTNINGVRTAACELKHGDRIQIGQPVLRFEFGSDEDAALPGKTVFLQTVLGPTGQEREPPRPSRSKDLLEAAYTLLNAIATNFNPCDLVDRILDATMVPAERRAGCIIIDNKYVIVCFVHAGLITNINITSTCTVKACINGRKTCYRIAGANILDG